MASVVTTILFILLLFLTGKIFEASKRVMMLLISIVLKTLNLFGCHISISEPSVHTSKVFNKTFKDIKVVKKSKHNNRIVHSINKASLLTLLFCVTVVAINIMYDGYVSNWLYDNVHFLRYIITSSESMSTVLVASMFSIMSFSLASLVSLWKDTKKYRIARKQMKLKNKVLSTMTSKLLLDAAKEKDSLRMDLLRRDSSDYTE